MQNNANFNFSTVKVCFQKTCTQHMYLQSLRTITTKLTIYYDGNCPLCLAEIVFLKRYNHKGLLEFVSLQSLDASCNDIHCELAMKTIHGRLGENEIIVGPEVFYQAYQRTDLRLINDLFSLRVVRFFYAKFYALFAKYRHQISRLIGPLISRIVRRKYLSSEHGSFSRSINSSG
jgi:predicted DCC family thiol-disulfide oxidoreductase YuxK